MTNYQREIKEIDAFLAAHGQSVKAELERIGEIPEEVEAELVEELEEDE